MYYDINTRSPLLEFFSEDEVKEIHYASVEVLERVGVDIYHPEAKDLLYSAGARVDNDLRVRIPSYLVEKALQLAPKRITLANRLGERTIFLEASKICFGTGSDLVYTIDHETGERRKTVLKDMERAALLSEHLSNIDFVMGYGLPSDIPPMVQELYEFYIMMKNTVKPMFVTVSSGRRDMLDYIYEMAVAVAGSSENLQSNPFFVFYGEPVRPLKHGHEGLEVLLFSAEHRIPVTYVPCTFSGANAPVTMAGALTVTNASVLSGLVIHQLKNPGAPFIWGGSEICPLDMRDAVWPAGAPEWRVGGAVSSQIARHYGLPAFQCGGLTDSKTVDEQALIEGAYTLVTTALTGGNIIHDVGFLESGLTGSLNFLVMMNESINLAKRMLRNNPVNRETLAIDIIEELGPSGDFFTNPHTMRHFKQELWYPALFDRSNYNKWVEKGCHTLGNRAQDEAKRILSLPPSHLLPEEILKEVEQIIQSAEKSVILKG